MGIHIADIRTRLAKKTTFEAALADLQALLDADPSIAASSEFQAIVQRSATLLKSRYTAPAFWTAGRRLYEAAKEKAPDPACRAKYDTYIDLCAHHLGEDSSQSAQQNADRPSTTEAQPASSYLFEGQLSQGTEGPPRRRGLHDLLAAMAAQAAVGQPGTDGEGGEAPAAAPGREQPAPSFEALEEELALALAESMAEAEELEGARPGGGAPPASRHAVRALVRERLSEARLQELGRPECSVCREDFAAGEEVHIMPCSDHHMFHPPCLAPWLSEHNSCPMCRHELPTDDDRYERRKEREATEKEAQKGAANAVGHTDFLYV